MYTAKIIRARLFEEIPGADRIRTLVYNGMRFVVGKDEIQEGDLVCLFPADGQLSHDFCHNNNLYRHGHLNKDPLKSGYFDDNRRVRAQPFRGVKSEGFVCTAHAFTYIKGDFHFTDGYEFDEINGQRVCEKYVTEATKLAIAKRGNKSFESDVDYALRKHFETEKLDFKIDTIPDAKMLVTITEKLHGTSGRTGYVLVKRAKHNLIERFVNGLFKKRVIKPSEEAEYELVTGTRNTIVNDRKDIQNPDHSEHYRWSIHRFLENKLHKGETIYYEIVGRDSYGTPIMGIHSTDKLSDKNIQKMYGKVINYSYGCLSNEYRVYVYRITYQNEDGIVFEVPYFDMVRRANELNLDTVPLLDAFYAVDREFAKDSIMKSVDFELKSGLPSKLDTRHIREGVCVRVESEKGFSILKKKTFEFLVMEGIAKDKSDTVDLEEIS